MMRAVSLLGMVLVAIRDADSWISAVPHRRSERSLMLRDGIGLHQNGHIDPIYLIPNSLTATGAQATAGATATKQDQADQLPKEKKKPKLKVTPEAEELEAVLRATKKAVEENTKDGENEDSSSRLLVAQVAPSVRVSLSEEFGLEPGAFSSGLLVASLKELGFDLVLDTNTAADLTICEEGTELLRRIRARQRQMQNKKEEEDENENETFPADFSSNDNEEEGEGPMPMFTSCCPGWMVFVEKSAPELSPYISTCKSPHMMYGAVLKRYSKDLLGCPPEQVYLTSVMPCVRKRGESDRAAFTREDVRDVDNVITTRDLGQMLRSRGIDPAKLKAADFDSPFQRLVEDAADKSPSGLGSGAGQLFGATGGVMEAAVRSVYELVTGEKLPRLELQEVRGLEGVKEAVVPLYNDQTGAGLENVKDLRVAVVHGLGNVKKLIAQMRSGNVHYDFVEVMACPGGCIGGGGQPKGANGEETLAARMKCIYALDRSLPIRRSHENPVVKELYERYVGEFGSEEAEALLHVKPVYGGAPSKTK